MRSNAKKIRFGVLSTARIGVKKVNPAMQKGEHTEVVAIASRSAEKGREGAHYLGIPRWHGSAPHGGEGTVIYMYTTGKELKNGSKINTMY